LVGKGIVASLARPGGNITGISLLTPEFSAKRLSLLKEVVPTLSRVTVLWNPIYGDFELDWRELRAAAATMAVTLHSLEVRSPGLESVLALIIAREGAMDFLASPIGRTTSSRSSSPTWPREPTCHMSPRIGRFRRRVD
jgi:putative ABC transport system substrate-binding protein